MGKVVGLALPSAEPVKEAPKGRKSGRGRADKPPVDGTPVDGTPKDDAPEGDTPEGDQE